jgi:hypothetical protein
MTQPVTRPESNLLNALSTSERERFEALAPFVGAASQSTADAAWLADCVTRHPTLQPVLAQHRALRTELHQRYAPLRDDIGLSLAKARIAALPAQRSAAHRALLTAPAPGWMERLRAWLQPSPAWAMALSVLILPLAFLAGRETAAPDPATEYATVRSAAKGLFDGPLLRVSYRPQTSEQVIRDLLLAQGAVVVGPTRLGDWFIKVAPARVEVVRAALAKNSAVVAAEVVPALPSELVDQP